MKVPKQISYEKSLTICFYLLFFLFALSIQLELSAFDPESYPDNLKKQPLSQEQKQKFMPPGDYATLVFQGAVEETAQIEIIVSNNQLELSQSQALDNGFRDNDVQFGVIDLAACTNIDVQCQVRMNLSPIADGTNNQQINPDGTCSYVAANVADPTQGLVLKVISNRDSKGNLKDTEIFCGDYIIQDSNLSPEHQDDRILRFFVIEDQLSNASPGEYVVVIELEIVL